MTEVKTDDYANLVTGLAGPGDKSQYSYFQEERRLWEPELNNMYEGSGLAARIVDRIVDDATREGFRLDGTDFDWQSLASDIEDFGIVPVVNKACKTSRLYGGSLIVMEVADGGEYSDPLDLANASALEGFSVFPSFRVYPDSYNSEWGMEAYMNPEWYSLLGVNGTLVRVHRSRCIRIEGVPLLSPYRAAERGGWGPSVLERVASELARLEQAEGYAGNIMHDLSIMTVKMPKLHAMMCGDEEGQEKAQQILDNLRMITDNLHWMALDSEDELVEVKRDITAFTPLIEAFVTAVIREENMPRVILMGEQPGGLRSSASDEVRGWYDHVAAWQERHLTRIYKRIMEVYFAVRENNGLPAPLKWTVDYDSLWQPDDQTQAGTLLTSAQAYQLLVTMGVMTVEEVRQEMISKGLISVGVRIPGPSAPTEIKPEAPGVELEAPADEDAAPSLEPVPPDLCSTKEAAAMLGVPTLTINNLCRSGKLRHWKFGSRMQVSSSEVLAFGQVPAMEES